MRRLSKFFALMMVLILALAGGLPAGAAGRAVPGDVEALVYYSQHLTEGDLVTRFGVEPRIQYDSFALARLSPAQRERLELAGATVQVLTEKRQVALAGGFDTRSGDGVPSRLRASAPAGKGVYLIQFDGPVKAEWLDALAGAGVELLDHVQSYTVVGRMTPAVMRKVEQLSTVVWVGYYQPGYKLASELTAGEAVVHFFPGTSSVAGAKGLEQAGLQVLHQIPGQALVSGNLAAMERAARMDDVAFIEPYAEPELMNAAARTIMKTDVAHAKTVTGVGQIVAVSDTGVHRAHEMFSESGKLVGVVDMAGDSNSGGGDGHGHGTHVAGSVLGDAPTYGVANNHDGQGFGARLVDVKIFNNSGSWAGGSDYYYFWNESYKLGARVNSNSWGSNSAGSYGASDRDADRITFDKKDFTLTIAAGNAGPNKTTVGSPAGSKNAITVGASLTGTPEAMANFSSRGPTKDGRLKPDVVAPGSYITSAKTKTTNEYTSMQGTSMATPQVGGAAAQVRQYFKDGFYPSGTKTSTDSRDVSGALVKAILINGAVEITGSGSDYLNEGKFPNNSQGWGRVNLERSLYFSDSTRQIRIWDEPTAPSTGSTWSQSITLPSGMTEAKFTLTWTDPAAASGASVTLINDLNLRVTAPNGAVFLGNNFTSKNPGYSVTGGSFDNRNTVEGVHLLPSYSFTGSMPSGTYTIEVIGANVPTAGSNFAVVVGYTSDGSSTPTLGDVAIMGDYNDQLKNLLTGQGFTVTSYGGSDYASVINNLDGHRVVVLHQVASETGFNNLLTAAANKQKGLVFASSYPVGSHSMGVLGARTSDPSSTAHNWGNGAVQLTVAQSHPVFNGYAAGTTVTIINGGDNDYQTYNGYTGTTIGSNAMSNGQPGMVGVKDAGATGGARHVVMGSFGASGYTNTGHWTADGKQIFNNAVNWAGGWTGSAPEPVTLALMGDYNNQIGDYLRSRGYVVDTYSNTDYAGVQANLSKYHAVVLHRVSNASGFDSLRSNAGQVGIIYLSAYSVSNHAMGVLSSRTGNPSGTSQNWADGAVKINLSDASHPIFAGLGSSPITVINGGDNDYQAYTGFTGTTIGTSAMPRGHSGMVGIRDNQGSGGNREVILGSMGASAYTHMGHWTETGKQLLVNAVEWARRP